MPRQQVNPDREHGCSTGLHVGTYDYARSFGNRLLLVSVNPRDVVSVPRDCEFQKMRVCRYTVLSVHGSHGPVTTPSYSAETVFPDDSDDTSFDEDDEFKENWDESDEADESGL